MSAPLTVGLLRVVLHLPESGSLKSKRMIVSGLLSRLRQQLKVSAAEVGELDRWQLAELAVATVSGDGRHADEVLASSTTRDLLEGSGLTLEDAGSHDLKGLSGSRTLYRVVQRGPSTV